MAVDTADKRAAALNFGSYSGELLPVPDGSVGTGDQAHLLGLFSDAFPPGGIIGWGSNEPIQGLRLGFQVVPSFGI